MASSTFPTKAPPSEQTPLLPTIILKTMSFINQEYHCPGGLPLDSKADDQPVSIYPITDDDNDLSNPDPIRIQPAPPLPGLPSRQSTSALPQDPRLQRLIPDEEWTKIAYSLGAIRSLEDSKLIHPSTGLWPPRGMAPGLYRDIVFYRTKYFYLFQIITIIRWIGMVSQIFLGASLTAIGSFNVDNHSLLVTALAALNTVIAGTLALIHNSGLPDRYRADRTEFIHVEDHVRQILEGAVVDDGMTTEDIITECFERFKQARENVFAGDPETVVSTMIGNLRVNASPFRQMTYGAQVGDLHWRPSPALSDSRVYVELPGHPERGPIQFPINSPIVPLKDDLIEQHEIGVTSVDDQH